MENKEPIAICRECKAEFTTWISDSKQCPSCEGEMMFFDTLSTPVLEEENGENNLFAIESDGKVISFSSKKEFEEWQKKHTGGTFEFYKEPKGKKIAFCPDCANILPKHDSRCRMIPQEPMEWKSKLFNIVAKLDNGSHSANQLQGIDEAVSELIQSQIKQAEERGYKQGRKDEAMDNAGSSA